MVKSDFFLFLDQEIVSTKSEGNSFNGSNSQKCFQREIQYSKAPI